MMTVLTAAVVTLAERAGKPSQFVQLMTEVSAARAGQKMQF